MTVIGQPIEVNQPATDEQLQLPGIDWSQYERREIPTDAEIIAALPPADYYERLSITLREQYDVIVSPGQLSTAEFMARKAFYLDRMKQAARG